MVQRTDPEVKKTILESWLRNKLPSAENISVSQMEKAAGGYGSEIHFFDLTWQKDGQVGKEGLVIREEPKEFRVFHRYHTAREFAIMKSLQDSDVPVPKTYWLETDESVLGAPFYIMGRVDGEILDPQQFGDEPSGPLYEAGPEGRRRLYEQALEVISRIHKVDLTELGITYEGAPRSGLDAIDQQIGFYKEMADWIEFEPRSMISRAFDWFEKNKYEPERMSLCWGDTRLGNLIYHDGEIVAVIDWDMTHIGVAETDLAYFLTIDWLTGDSGLRGPRWEGVPGREEIIQLYESSAGKKLENLFYNEAFALLKISLAFYRVVKSMPGVPPEFIPENPLLDRLSAMLRL